MKVILFNEHGHHIGIEYAKNRYWLKKKLKQYKYHWWKNIKVLNITHKKLKPFHIVFDWHDYWDNSKGHTDKYVWARHRVEAIYWEYDTKCDTMAYENFICEEVKEKMIKTLIPYGAIAKHLITYKFEQDGKFYVYDKGFNKYKITPQDYEALKVKVWQPKD